MVKINVLLFAGLRESAGIGQVSLELPSGSNVSDAVSAAEISTPRAWRAPESLAMALNHEYVDGDQLLSDGDELALIPPVSGGSSQQLSPIVLITNEPKEINNLTFFNSTLSNTPKVPKATNKICNSIILGLLLGCFKISTNLSLYVII